MISPIILFVYNRILHTKRTIDNLKKNYLSRKSDLIIFSDGSRNDSDLKDINVVREYIRKIEGFKSIRIIERDSNWGLSKSIISDVTEVINRYGNAIVLEDDLITAPHFLEYMNQALNYYKDEEKVISIHGYIYPIISKLPETFFIKGADCWGWATWKRGWDIFNSDGKQLIQEIYDKKLQKEFNFNGCYDYTGMLKDQIKGRNNSWAIRWYASAFLKDKLTLYPGRTLVQNIGYDGSGMHCRKTNRFNNELYNYKISVKNIPVTENINVRREIEKYFQNTKLILPLELMKKLRKLLALNYQR